MDVVRIPDRYLGAGRRRPCSASAPAADAAGARDAGRLGRPAAAASLADERVRRSSPRCARRAGAGRGVARRVGRPDRRRLRPTRRTTPTPTPAPPPVDRLRPRRPPTSRRRPRSTTTTRRRRPRHERPTTTVDRRTDHHHRPAATDDATTSTDDDRARRRPPRRRSDSTTTTVDPNATTTTVNPTRRPRRSIPTPPRPPTTIRTPTTTVGAAAEDLDSDPVLPPVEAPGGPGRAAGRRRRERTDPLDHVPRRRPGDRTATTSGRAATAAAGPHKGNDVIGDRLQPLLAMHDGVIDRLLDHPTAGYGVVIRDAEGWEYHVYHVNNDTPGTDDGADDGTWRFAQGIAPGSAVTAGQLIGVDGRQRQHRGLGASRPRRDPPPDGTAINPYWSLRQAQRDVNCAVDPVDAPARDRRDATGCATGWAAAALPGGWQPLAAHRRPPGLGRHGARMWIGPAGFTPVDGAALRVGDGRYDDGVDCATPVEPQRRPPIPTELGADPGDDPVRWSPAATTRRRSTTSTASGAYQFLDSSWGGYGGYRRAKDAPPAVQDAKAAELATCILDRNGGDVSTIPVSWYIGHVPVGAEWDTVPPYPGNRLTPRGVPGPLDEALRRVPRHARRLGLGTPTSWTPADTSTTCRTVIVDKGRARRAAVRADPGPDVRRRDVRPGRARRRRPLRPEPRRPGRRRRPPEVAAELVRRTPAPLTRASPATGWPSSTPARRSDFRRRHPRSAALRRRGRRAPAGRRADGLDAAVARPVPAVRRRGRGRAVHRRRRRTSTSTCASATPGPWAATPLPAVTAAVADRAGPGHDGDAADGRCGVGRRRADPAVRAAGVAVRAQRHRCQPLRPAPGPPRHRAAQGRSCSTGATTGPSTRRWSCSTAGARRAPRTARSGPPVDPAATTVVVPFNDVDALRRGARGRRRGLRARRAGADEHRHRAARAGLPRRAAPADPGDRHAAADRRDPHDLRRARRVHRRRTASIPTCS